MEHNAEHKYLIFLALSFKSAGFFITGYHILLSQEQCLVAVQTSDLQKSVSVDDGYDNFISVCIFWYCIHAFVYINGFICFRIQLGAYLILAFNQHNYLFYGVLFCFFFWLSLLVCVQWLADWIFYSQDMFTSIVWYGLAREKVPKNLLFLDLDCFVRAAVHWTWLRNSCSSTFSWWWEHNSLIFVEFCRARCKIQLEGKPKPETQKLLCTWINTLTNVKSKCVVKKTDDGDAGLNICSF